MRPIHLQPNQARNGFKVNSDYAKAQLKEWLKKYSRFELKPILTDSMKGRRYLYGAVVPDYCQWQYSIDPRAKGQGDRRKLLFMRDFNSDVVKNREGYPVRLPLSSKGMVSELTNTYCEWATENGAPVPNPELFKKYRDQYSMDPRWDNFHDWLDYLELASDSMPSSEIFTKLTN